MKKLLVVLTVAVSSVCLSQIVVSVDDQNTLYRGGYKNRVIIGTMDGRPFDLKVHNGTIIYDTIFVKNKNEEPIQNVETVLLPGGGHQTKVVFVDPDTGLPFDTLELSVSELPKPTIRLGSIVDGESAHSSALIRATNKLIAFYPPEIPLSVSISVVSWKVSVNGEEKWIAGKGASLTSEARDLIRQAESGDKITFMTNIRYPNGRILRKKGVFTVR